MLFGPLTAGLLVVLVLGLIDVLGDGLPRSVDGGLNWSVDGGIGGRFALGLFGALLVGLCIWPAALFTGFVRNEIPLRSIPNEDIRRSMQNGLIARLTMGLVSGLGSLANGLGLALFYGLYGGIFFGSLAGGKACLHHFALRLVLWHNNFAPLHYVGAHLLLL